MSLIIGTLGVIFILVAFMLDEFYKKINSETVTYNALNIIGSGLLTYYAFSLQSWPFVALNAMWLLVAVIKLLKIAR